MKAVFEKVEFREGSSIKAFRTGGAHFEAPWHFHPEFELTYIIKSNGIRYVGNNVSHFSAGDLVLLGPNLPHCWINEQLQGNAQAIVIQWSRETYHNIPEFEAIHRLLNSADRGLRFNVDRYKNTLPQLTQMINYSPIERFLNLTRVLIDFVGDNEIEILAGASYQADLSTDTNDRINTVLSFVQQHFNRKVKLQEVASEVNMTEQSFSRFFSKNMSRSFFVFLNEYRCNRASRLLLETDLQVSEIGYKCGYESLPFFYQQFKKFKNYSPLNFRKMYRKLS